MSLFLYKKSPFRDLASFSAWLIGQKEPQNAYFSPATRLAQVFTPQIRLFS